MKKLVLVVLMAAMCGCAGKLPCVGKQLSLDSSMAKAKNDAGLCVKNGGKAMWYISYQEDLGSGVYQSKYSFFCDDNWGEIYK